MNELKDKEKQYKQFALDIAALYEKYVLTYGEIEEYLDRAKYDVRKYQESQLFKLNN